jgi:hypothetical protein
MSYDIYLTDPKPGEPCGHCGGTGKEPAGEDKGWSGSPLDWNYTSNCAPMWRKAGADLAEFHGKLAGECVPLLAAAIAAMEADPDAYRELNPPNGWGDYDSLLRALKKLLKGFEGNPHMVVWISR